MSKVFIVDDEMTMLQTVGELLRAEGHQVIPFTNPQTALEALGNVAPELVLANLARDHARGLGPKLLQQARSLTPPALVLMMTNSGNMEATIEAMKRGAYDYLQKPFTLDELKLRVQRALSYHTAVAENVALRKQLHSRGHFQQIIGVSPAIHDIVKAVARLAECDSTILISGPSGSGKELVARSVHFNSRRRFAPFLVLTCSSVPEHRLESELFGQRKGTVGSGVEETPGLLKEAEGGSLFLREIEALPSALQFRLVEALRHERPQAPNALDGAVMDVRILAGSSYRLENRVAEGTFLGELHQRLSEKSVTLPALRHRSEDIPLLIAHFLGGKIHRRSGQPCVITPEAIKVCSSHIWPGNVRELEEALDHACALSQDGTIEVSHLPRAVQHFGSVAEPLPSTSVVNHSTHTSAQSEARPRVPHASTLQHDVQLSLKLEELVPLKKFLRDQEVIYLQRILAQVDGSKEKAAELLGISLATIYRKLAEPNTPPHVLDALLPTRASIELRSEPLPFA